MRRRIARWLCAELISEVEDLKRLRTEDLQGIASDYSALQDRMRNIVMGIQTQPRGSNVRVARSWAEFSEAATNATRLKEN